MNPKLIYKMEVFSNGDAQEQIISLLSKHNSGECEFTLKDLQVYLKMRGYLYSLVTNTMMVLDSDCEATLFYGDKCFMKVTLVEIHELVDSELE